MLHLGIIKENSQLYQGCTEKDLRGKKEEDRENSIFHKDKGGIGESKANEVYQ